MVMGDRRKRLLLGLAFTPEKTYSDKASDTFRADKV